MGKVSRGWALTRQSWTVLNGDLSLAVFPILSTVFAIVATVAIWAPVVIIRGLFDGQALDNHDPLYYIAGAATAYVSTFFAIFFNVALAACAVRSMRGEDTTIGEGLKAAAQRIGPILGWTFVTTTVGLLLQLLEERLPFAGKIATWLAGAAWAIASFFVVPVLALEGAGPVQSLKRSASVVKERWGESATGAATIAVVTAVISMAIVVVGVGGFLALTAIGQQVLAIVLATVAVAVIFVVAMLSSALNQIFRVALYQFAVTGQTPPGFSSELLGAAFERR